MNSKITDYIIEKIIFLCGIIAIVFVVLIFGFLLKEGFFFFIPDGTVKDFISYTLSKDGQQVVLKTSFVSINKNYEE